MGSDTISLIFDSGCRKCAWATWVVVADPIYADAILYVLIKADDVPWMQLKGEFRGAAVVEIGYWIGFTFGGQRWLKTRSAKQGEFDTFVKQQRAQN